MVHAIIMVLCILNKLAHLTLMPSQQSRIDWPNFSGEEIVLERPLGHDHTATMWLRQVQTRNV